MQFASSSNLPTDVMGCNKKTAIKLQLGAKFWGYETIFSQIAKSDLKLDH